MYRDYVRSLLVAGLACIVRPSNAIIWIVLGIELLIRLPAMQRGLLILPTLLCGCVCPSPMFAKPNLA